MNEQELLRRKVKDFSMFSLRSLESAEDRRSIHSSPRVSAVAQNNSTCRAWCWVWVESRAGHKRLAKTLAMLNQVLDRWVTETGGSTAGATFMCLIKALPSRGRDRWRQLRYKLAREISHLFTPVSTSLLCHLTHSHLRVCAREVGGVGCWRARVYASVVGVCNIDWKNRGPKLIKGRKWGLCSEQQSQDARPPRPGVKSADFRSSWATRGADRIASTRSILPQQKARLLYSTGANQRIANLPWHLALVPVFPEQFAWYVLKRSESNEIKRFSASGFAAGGHRGQRIRCRNLLYITSPQSWW